MISKRKAHVIIPTHSGHDTLNFAVLSAINQSLPPQRVTIIGDGASEEVRKLSRDLSREFTEVEFLDNPKLKNRGEKYRDAVIRSSDADFISYLCDDDLYMPNHLEVMSQHLEQFDFAHPRPTFVNPDGTFFFMLSGIESPRIKSWHKLVPQQNTISLTGASHTRDSYLSLQEGWDAGPPEFWTDLYMWMKFLSDQDVRTMTSPHTTTIKLMHTKENRDLHSRSDLIEYWYNITRQSSQLSSFQNRIETQFKETVFDNSVELIESLTAERDQVLASNSWRITKPLRKMGSLILKSQKATIELREPKGE